MMYRVDTCRTAARDAVADVEPTALHDLITDRLEAASMAPGVFTLACAAALDAARVSAQNGRSNGSGDGDGTNSRNGDGDGIPTDRRIADDTDTDPQADTDRQPETQFDLDAIAHHAAGVQLIYEGLRLTRTLAHEEPWASTAGDGRADLEILAADIMVARGFYLLARTEAAESAVRTVRRFGRDQTLRAAEGIDPESQATLDDNLERDVLVLAVHTGATAVDAHSPAALLGVASDVADEAAIGTAGGFPPVAECLPALAGDAEGVALEAVADLGVDVDAELELEGDTGERSPERPPAEVSTDRATSAGDP